MCITIFWFLKQSIHTLAEHLRLANLIREGSIHACAHHMFEKIFSEILFYHIMTILQVHWFIQHWTGCWIIWCCIQSNVMISAWKLLSFSGISYYSVSCYLSHDTIRLSNLLLFNYGRIMRKWRSLISLSNIRTTPAHKISNELCTCVITYQSMHKQEYFISKITYFFSPVTLFR